MKLFLSSTYSQAFANAVRAAVLSRGLYIVVPDELTLQAEKAALSALSIPGSFDIGVYGFDRLHYLLTGGSGAKSLPVLQGILLTARIASENTGRLKCFFKSAAHHGFAQSVYRIISGFKAAGITPEDLIQMTNDKGQRTSQVRGQGAESKGNKKNIKGVNALADGVAEQQQSILTSTPHATRRTPHSDNNCHLPNDEALRRKLSDIALLYSKYEREKEGAADANDRLLRTAELLRGGTLRGAELLYAGFDDLSRIELETAFAAEEGGASVSFACAEGSRLHRELTENERWKTEDGRTRMQKINDVIAGSDATRQSQQKNDNIPATIFHLPSSIDEIYRAAELITSYIIKGFRYRDIAIICGDLAASAPDIARIFAAAGINFFLDRPRDLTVHPFYAYAAAAMRAHANNLGAEDVLALAKNPYFGLARGEAEGFENYVLRYGIDRSGFRKKFVFDAHRFEQEQEEIREKRREETVCAETIRARLIETLETLAGGRDCAQNLERALNSAEAKKTTEELSSRAPYKEAAESLRMGFKMMGSALEYIRGAYHGGLAAAAFSRAFEVCCKGIGINVLPQYADSVFVGASGALRLNPPRVLIVLDANEGLYPAASLENGVLSNHDAEKLKLRGIESPIQSRFQEDKNLFDALNEIKSAENVHIFYSMAGKDGEPLLPSSILAKLRTVKAEYGVRSAECGVKDEKQIINNVQCSAFRKIPLRAEGVSSLRGGVAEQHSQQQLSTFTFQSSTSTSTPHSTLRTPHFSAENISTEKLYFRRGTTKVSQIETFYNCPYKHFLQYGLRLGERPEAEPGAPDKIGILFHSVAESYVEKYVRKGITAEGEAPAAADAVFAELTAGVDYEPLRQSRSGLNMLRRLQAEARALCIAVSRQCRVSNFKPEFIEVRFPGSDGFKAVKIETGGRVLKLSGRIDRVDTLERDGKKYAVVFDYKTGNADAGMSKIRLGINLQLPIYLAAAREAGFTPAGAFYFPVHNREERSYRLKGYILGDDGIPFEADRNLERNGESAIIGVKLKNDGNFYKRGPVLDGKQIDDLIALGLDMASRAVEAAAAGERAAFPVKDACRRCHYGRVCRFDAESGAFRANDK